MTDDIDHPKAAWNRIRALGNALDDGEHSLGAVPNLLKRILTENGGLWREFEPPGGVVVRHERFEDFVTAHPTDGLGASVELIKRLVADDADADLALREALKQSHGGDRGNQYTGGKRNNVTLATEVVRGNSASYTRARLRDERPDLFERVLTGDLTPHAAAVEAGFRRPTATIRLDSLEAIADVLQRRLPPEYFNALASELAARAAHARAGGV